jgi:hypothetical protein
VYGTYDEAVADISFVVCTTAKKRSAKVDYIPAPRLAQFIADKSAVTGKIAVVFGSEESGLPNEILLKANVGVTIPMATGYPSLNLSQAVMTIAYECSAGAERVRPAGVENGTPCKAAKEDKQLEKKGTLDGTERENPQLEEYGIPGTAEREGQPVEENGIPGTAERKGQPVEENGIPGTAERMSSDKIDRITPGEAEGSGRTGELHKQPDESNLPESAARNRQKQESATWQQLQERTTGILQEAGIHPPTPLYHRIIERMSMMKASDARLVHSVTARIQELLKKSV